MDFTAWWFLFVVSLLGYLAVGLVIGQIISNLVHNDGGTVADARAMGGIAVAAWPLAMIVMLAMAIWEYVLEPALTPKKHREQMRAEKAQRKAEGKPAVGAYVD